LTKFHNTVHIIEPDTKNEIDEEFLNNFEELALKNKVSLVSVDKLGEKEHFKKRFSIFVNNSNLSNKEQQKLENYKEEILEKDNFKERFLEYIGYEFGIQDSNEGGLFYNEPIEGGINIIFAHVHDIRQLDKEKRDKFLKDLFLKKKYSYVEGEPVTSSPKLHFAIFKENLNKYSDEELTTGSPYRIDEIKERYNKTPTKLIIRYNLGYEIYVPPILDKELKMVPMNKALYFFTLALKEVAEEEEVVEVVEEETKPKNGITFEKLSNSPHSENLTRIYRKLDNYEIEKYGDDGKKGEKTEELTVKIFKDSLSSLKSRTKKNIQDHIYAETGDWNFTFEVIEKISYVKKNKFLRIPLDRDEVAITSQGLVTNPINKILNTKFKIIK
jgi:hypothetical protein